MEKEESSLLQTLSEDIRTSTFETILNANSGHLGATSSSVELMTALYFGKVLRFDPSNPHDTRRDRVYVRGHVGPLRYKIFSLLGWIEEKELATYRRFGSRLKGHESMHHVPGIDITPSGSLGMLLSYGAGSAFMTKKLGLPSRHFVFLGDGEEQEGNVSEAARHIASLGLDNIVCILDRNTKQLSRPTIDVDSATDIRKVWAGYGWNVLEVRDGHNPEEIIEAYKKAIESRVPTFIIANTKKGRGLEGHQEHFNGYHTLGACHDKSVVTRAISARKGKFDYDKEELTRRISEIQVAGRTTLRDEGLPIVREYAVKIQVNPENNLNLDNSQSDYFTKLAQVVKSQKIPFYFMTPDLIHKEDVSVIGLDAGEAYLDLGIREQHTIAMAHGMSQTNPNARIFINYFDAFLYRASDQLNAAAQGKSRLILLSEMSGLTQGKNGETHQSSGQPAVPIMMPGVHFYEPADVQDLYNVLNYGFSYNPGIFVVRSHRANINPLERSNVDKENIDSYVTFDAGGKPDITFVGSGYVVGGAVEAAKELFTTRRIRSRVVNAINLKKLDEQFVRMLENDRPVLTIYNGNPLLLQSLVSQAVMEHDSSRPSIIAGHGFERGDSGSIEDLTRAYHLDSAGIISLVNERFRLR